MTAINSALAAPPVFIHGAAKLYDGAPKPTFSDLNLTCPGGKVTVIVGPSGCGKTTLLRAICGLEPFSSGQLFFGERDVTHTPAEHRGVAMVFQNYALYPDKTVAANIGFPLKMARLSAAEIAERVKAAAELVRISDHLHKRPGALSGGQRQRVGIARAIVRGPDVLLMDEPLSNLDTKLRAEMRSELGALQRRIGATTVYVTHDQTEALTLADHLVVMNGGLIEHQGSPDAVFRHPATTFVADFMGRMNLLTGPWQGLQSAAPSGLVSLGFRPEEVIPGLAPGAGYHFTASLLTRELLGTEALLTLDQTGQKLRVRVPVALPTAEQMTFSVLAEHLHFFNLHGKRI